MKIKKIIGYMLLGSFIVFHAWMYFTQMPWYMIFIVIGGSACLMAFFALLHWLFKD